MGLAAGAGLSGAMAQDYPKGKEYVVFVAGGNGILTPRLSDQMVAFALPN